MNYACYVNRIKSFIIDNAQKVNIDELPNNHCNDFKITAYCLFDELITAPPPFDYQEPHPMVALFNLVKQSICRNNDVAVAILQQLEAWWVEWHFVATMNTQLLSKHHEKKQEHLNEQAHQPMRNHELSYYATLFSVLPLPICNVCITTGDFLKVNQRFIDAFGFTTTDTPNLEVWWEKAYPDLANRAAAQALWAASVEKVSDDQRDIPANDYLITCKNGEQVTMQVLGICIGNEYLVIFNDTTERVKTQQMLSEMAFLDSLTKIANRRRFDEKIAAEFTHFNTVASPLSLILIDIDNFKQYNDSYGHLAGDNCLRKVAQQLSEIVSRPDDFVARYGGEEFVILLPQTDQQGALFIADEIQKGIEKLAIVHQGSFTGYLSISMGVNTITADTCDQAGDHVEFINAADNALYYAKRQGRNCIAVATNEALQSS